MNLAKVIRRTFELKQAKKWDLLYVLLDVHGVILPHSWHKTNEFVFLGCDGNWPNKCALDGLEVLRWFSKREDFRLILWTSSYPSETDPMMKWLSSLGIDIDYVNGNPNEPNNAYADFTFKPYFNILLDDKAGFEPEDWAVIKQTLIEIGEWDKFPTVDPVKESTVEGTLKALEILVANAPNG